MWLQCSRYMTSPCSDYTATLQRLGTTLNHMLTTSILGIKLVWTPLNLCWVFKPLSLPLSCSRSLCILPKCHHAVPGNLGQWQKWQKENNKNQRETDLSLSLGDFQSLRKSTFFMQLSHGASHYYLTLTLITRNGCFYSV